MTYSPIQRRVIAALANDTTNRSLTITALRDRTQDDDLTELREAGDALIAAGIVVIDNHPLFIGYELRADLRDLYYGYAAAGKLYSVLSEVTA